MAATRRLTIRRGPRRFCRLVAVALVGIAVAGGLPAQDGRVIVLGVDGMDFELTERWMREGRLPELTALAELGTFRSLLPTNPAQSPVSWATLTTGRSPGETGIFDFVRRRVENGKVKKELSLVEVEERPLLTLGWRALAYLGAVLVSMVPWLLFRRRRSMVLVGVAVMAFLLLLLRWTFNQIPESLRVPKNARGAEALWEAFDREGIPATSLFAPCAFPAPELDSGHLLCGLGVPDVLGTQGSYAVFRADAVPDSRRTTAMGGRDVPLLENDGGGFDGASVRGPRAPTDGKDLSVAVALKPAGAGLELELQGQKATLVPGRFSDFLPIRFAWGDLVPGIHGLVRFRLLEGTERMALYQEPVGFDPRKPIPWAPISAPAGYAAELAKAGLFETLGWATATNPYQDEMIDDATILEDVQGLVRRQHAMILDSLASSGSRVHFSVLSTPDRVQHVFWRDLDPAHPAHDAAGAARRGELIFAAYAEVDALVGKIRATMKPGDRLLVVSDHGFAPFRHAVNLNLWLANEGYLVARADSARSLERDLGSPVENVDWSKTRAYSLGLGQIWLNVAGREPEGIVKPEDVDALLNEIAGKLVAFRHEERPVIRSAKRGTELWKGSRMKDAPDLVVGFERGYRVSWQSCLLGLDERLVAPNRSRWSGDHCSVDPDLVKGVLFSSLPLADGDATVADVYPTLRALLGLKPMPELDGRSLAPGRR